MSKHKTFIIVNKVVKLIKINPLQFNNVFKSKACILISYRLLIFKNHLLTKSTD